MPLRRYYTTEAPDSSSTLIGSGGSASPALGKRDPGALRIAFPGSPSFEAASEQVARARFETYVMAPALDPDPASAGRAAQISLGVPQFFRDYNASNPDDAAKPPTTTVTAIQGGNQAGIPYNSFAPETASPGSGSVSPTTVPEGPVPFKGNGGWGVGTGLVDVRESSRTVHKTTLGSFLGRYRVR